MRKVPYYPPSKKDILNYNAGIQPVEQEIEYTYKVRKELHMTIYMLGTAAKHVIMPSTTWYIPEKDLIADFEKTNHGIMEIDEDRLKHVLTREIWRETPPEEVEKMNLPAREDGKQRKFRQLDTRFQALNDYLKDIMSENVLYFIQHIASDYFETPIGTITREENDIRYTVNFAYKTPDDSVQFGEYRLLPADVEDPAEYFLLPENTEKPRISRKEKLYTIDDASETLGLHHMTIRKYIKNGKMQAVKIGKAWKIKHSEIVRIRDSGLEQEKIFSKKISL